MPETPDSMAQPPERDVLEPYASVLLDVVMPEALRGRWFETGGQPAAEELEVISRRINDYLRQRAVSVHPAIYVHALLVCCSFFRNAVEDLGNLAEWERQSNILDETFSLLQHLMLHHSLFDLYVLFG